jgi:tetratricopeptide (TPR) repeat protein
LASSGTSSKGTNKVNTMIRQQTSEQFNAYRRLLVSALVVVTLVPASVAAAPGRAKGAAKPAAGKSTPKPESAKPKSATGAKGIGPQVGSKSMLRSLSGQEGTGDKWAVVIGISKFADPKVPSLKYSAKDAKDFYDYLVDPNYGKFKADHVKLLTDEQANTVNIRDTLGDSFLPHAVNPNDLVVIYLSTHGSPAGMDIGHVNYIVAHDTEVNRLFSTGIEMRDLVKKLKERLRTRRILLVLDTCYSGAGGGESSGKKSRANADSSSVAQGIGSMVICSSSPSQRSWESDEIKNSYFTRHLIDALKTNPNSVTIDDAFSIMKNRVQAAVQKDKGESQTPMLAGGFEGPKLILGAEPAVNRPAPVTAPLDGTSSAPRSELASYGIAMRNAKNNFNTAKFWEARHDLDSAIKSNPKSVESQLMLADLLDVNRNYDEAFRAAQTAVAYDLNSAQARQKFARAYWRLNQNAEALREAEKSVSLDPGDSMSHFWLGKMNECFGKFDFAEQEYRKALELNSLNGRAYLALGQMLHEHSGKDARVAEAFAKRAVDCDDHDVEACLALSRHLLKRGEAAKAETILKKAILVDPTNPYLHSELGNAIAAGKTERKAEAENELRKGADLGKNIGYCHYTLARFLYADGLIDDAEKEFRAAVRLDSKLEDALVGLANLVLKDKKSYDGVELLYRAALQLNPRNAVAMLGIGHLKLEQYHDSTGAETILRQVIAMEPKMSEPHVVLGQALQVQNRALEARESFEKGVTLNPNNADAQFQLGLLYLATDKAPDKAFQHVKKAAELAPNNVTYQLKLGRLQDQLYSRFEESAACYRKAMELDSVNAEAHLRLGLLLIEKMNLRRLGCDEIRKAYALNYDDPETKSARAKYLKD